MKAKEETMRIAAIQHNPTIGDIAGNTEKIRSAYLDAAKEGADLVVAPELALLGYPPKDLLEREDFIRRQNEALEELARDIGSTPLLIGAAELNPGEGKLLYNAAIMLSEGEVTDTRARKQLLPTYDVFDEHRHFAPWRDGTLVTEIAGKRVGILICEDIWAGSETQNTRIYQEDPAKILTGHAEVLIVLNASPYYLGKGDVRKILVSKLAKRIKMPVIYVNQVGGNDELLFDGRSFATNASGEVIAQAPSFREAVLHIDLDTNQRADVVSDAESLEELKAALLMGIRDYVEKTGAFPGGAVLGLSGGIDSALVAALAAEALGSKKVKALAMPSKFSSEGSISDAEALAKNLGIELLRVPIEPAYQALGEMLHSPIGWEDPVEVTEENVQSRIRGLLLMAVSNRERRIVLGTGNKSEFAMGYATLYGDMAAGLLVIADLPKTLVFALAEHMNRDGEVIPRSIIEKPPSAELRPNQQDTDSLPPYDVLDPILEDYIEELMDVEALVAAGHDAEIAKRVVAAVDRMEFKRQQAAPGLKVTNKAFGSGRRMPIAAKYS